MLDAMHTKNRLKEEVNGLKEEVNGLKEEVNVLKEEVSFLGAGFFTALADQTHTDIQLKPANTGLSMPAHRALLVFLSLSLSLSLLYVYGIVPY
jgi:hypothetical protein